MVLCSVLIFCTAMVTLISSREWYMLALRIPNGFVTALGTAPAMALPSEISPGYYRAAIMAGREIVFCMGIILGAIFVIIDDPYYQSMDWRADLFISHIPTLPFIVASYYFLLESPASLASQGRHEEARAILDEMRQMNGRPDVDINYTTGTSATAPQSSAPVRRSFWDDLTVVFGPGMIGNTIALLFMSFTLHSFLVGHSFAFPQIATNSGITSLPPGYHGLIHAVVTLIVGLLSVPACFLFSLRTLAMIGLIVGMVGPALFAWSGAIEERSRSEAIAFYFGQVSPYFCCIFGFIACNQLAADLCPPRVASTFLGLIVGVGHIGSVTVPFVFALCGYWPRFYLFLACLAALSLVSGLSLLRFQPVKQPVSG